MKQKIGIFPLWWLLIVIQLVNQLHNKILCTYLWLVHKNGLDAVANHWTWSQSWSLLYRRPASFLILIQVLKWSQYALDFLSHKLSQVTQTASWHQTTNPESTNPNFLMKICRLFWLPYMDFHLKIKIP